MKMEASSLVAKRRCMMMIVCLLFAVCCLLFVEFVVLWGGENDVWNRCLVFLCEVKERFSSTAARES